MATEVSNSAIARTFVAGADLSTAQYKFVKLNSSGQVILVSAATDRPVGVLQNSPASGGQAAVTIVGGTKVLAGGTASAGNPMFSGSAGTAVTLTFGTTGSAAYVTGTYLDDAVSGDIVTAVVSCVNSARGL